MKRFESIFFVSVFVVSLGLGISTGKSIGVGQKDYVGPDNYDAYVSATPIIPNLSEPLPSFSILVVGLSDINEENTNLESVWWVFFNGDNHRFSLIPVYPAIGDENLEKYQSPHDPIEISSEDLEHLGNLEIISSQNIIWDHLIMIDQTALNTIITTTGSNTGKGSTSGMLEGSPNTWEDPRAALTFQTGIWQYFCSHGGVFSQANKVEEVLDLFGNRIQSDLNTQDIMDFWIKLNHNGLKINCEFPWQE